MIIARLKDYLEHFLVSAYEDPRSVEYTDCFKWPQKKKIMALRFSDLTVHAKNPFRPIHSSKSATFKHSCSPILKWGQALSWRDHMSAVTSKGISSRYNGR